MSAVLCCRAVLCPAVLPCSAAVLCRVVPADITAGPDGKFYRCVA